MLNKLTEYHPLWRILCAVLLLLPFVLSPGETLAALKAPFTYAPASWDPQGVAALATAFLAPVGSVLIAAGLLGRVPRLSAVGWLLRILGCIAVLLAELAGRNTGRLLCSAFSAMAFSFAMIAGDARGKDVRSFGLISAGLYLIGILFPLFRGGYSAASLPGDLLLIAALALVGLACTDPDAV